MMPIKRMLSLCIASEIFTELNFLDRLYIHLSSANKGKKKEYHSFTNGSDQVDELSQKPKS